MATQNNVTPMLPQDEEGITGGAEKQPYQLEISYGLEKCANKATLDETVYYIGISDNATLQRWLGDIEEADGKLWKRKIVEEADGTLKILWQEATATDFEVVEIIPQLNTNRCNVAIKATDDELVELIKAIAKEKQGVDITDTQAIMLIGLTMPYTACIKVTTETGLNTKTQFKDVGGGTLTCDAYVSAGIARVGGDETFPVFEVEANGYRFDWWD